MPRYKLLQQVDVTLAVPTTDPATPGTKSDVEIAFAGADEHGNFTFDLPAYDTATHNTVDALHVSLYEKPAGGTAPTIPTDPAQVVTAHLHYSTGCASLTGGGKVVVDATAAPEGEFVAALVAEFDA